MWLVSLKFGDIFSSLSLRSVKARFMGRTRTLWDLRVWPDRARRGGVQGGRGERGSEREEVSIIALVTPRDLSFSIGGY